MRERAARAIFALLGAGGAALPLSANAQQPGCVDLVKAEQLALACRELAAEGRCDEAIERCQDAADACAVIPAFTEGLAHVREACKRDTDDSARRGEACNAARGCAPGLRCLRSACAPAPAVRETILEYQVNARALAMHSPCDARQLLELACAMGHHTAQSDLMEALTADLTERRRACTRYRGARCPAAIAPVSPDGMAVSLVPAGPYLRGSDHNAIQEGLKTCRETYTTPEKCDVQWFHRESPQRSVQVAAFYIDRLEVSNAQYTICVADGICPKIDYSQCSLFQRDTGRWLKGGTPHPDIARPEHPVVCVTWEEANTYCRWAGKRLPTEAEWEKAARGTDGRQFPWGAAWNGAWLNWGERTGFASQDGWETTAPVGTFPQNRSPFGAMDMAGNVWEWTRDYHSDAYYEGSPDQDPVNTTPSPNRVMRGGAWSFAGNGARSAYRYFGDPEGRDDAVGFRCAASAQ